MTHDDKRHGTATLFAALHTLDGNVIGMCGDRRRHQEWLKFLRRIDNATPKEKQIHLIADNYAPTNIPKCREALPPSTTFPHPLHATSASWLHMVERFFRDLTQKQLRRGIFRDVQEFIRAIGNYVVRHNDKPKPSYGQPRPPKSWAR